MRSLAVREAVRTRWCGLMQAAWAAPAAPCRRCWVPALEGSLSLCLDCHTSEKKWQQTPADGPWPLIQRGCRPLAKVAHRPRSPSAYTGRTASGWLTRAHGTCAAFLQRAALCT